MHATNPQNTHESIGLQLLEQADPRATKQPGQHPVVVVFDTDSKRMGDYGGFFLANDYNAQAYEIAGASKDPKACERVNSPSNRIPGVHFPDLVHFALVAPGVLFTVNDIYHFEAIVFCEEVTHRDSGQRALLKLTLKGPAAVKLHHYFTIGIEDALERMNKHYHALATQLLESQQITKARFNSIQSQKTTAQMIWIPVPIQRGVQIGRTEEKSVLGTMIYTDEPIDNSMKHVTRWPTISLNQLTTPDTDGGLLMTGNTQRYCQTNREYYQKLLRTRAANKGQIKETPVLDENSQGNNPLPNAHSQPPVLATNSRASLLKQVRARLSATGKSETAPDVIRRMTEFGSPTLENMPLPQLAAFDTYVQGYALRNRKQATPKTAGNSRPSAAA